MKADNILKKHEDANEMHFHEADRKWIIEAMEEYAALRQPPVIGSVCDNCGCHPNVIYTTSKGRFCERCKPAS